MDKTMKEVRKIRDELNKRYATMSESEIEKERQKSTQSFLRDLKGKVTIYQKPTYANAGNE